MAITYYNVTFSEVAEHGVARGKTSNLFVLPSDGLVREWPELSLELTNGEVAPDYMANDLGVRLCSPRMRDVLDAFAGANDVLQWLPVRVLSPTETSDYWVLHFPYPGDVLGSSTLRSGDFVVRPAFALSKLAGHAVFTYKGAGTMRLTMRSDVVGKLELVGCNGFEATPVRTDPRD